jgi:adenylosuccinate lyase
MGALAQQVGKQTAHERVHAAAARARESGRPLRDVLVEDPLVGGVLPDGQIDRLVMAPTPGLAEQLVDRVTGRAIVGGS